MPLLFDASAIINLIMRGSGKVLSSTRNGSVLDLTQYEIGNAVWRLCALEKKLTSEEASTLLGTATDLQEQLGRVPFQELDANRILEIAISDKLTFYDASYVVGAELKRMTLVTDDAELREVARKYVSVQRSTAI
ncbi:MAG: type II toxin-antitoxin system VapC family toxin [Candidatus Bathyarchaeia archaeon]